MPTFFINVNRFEKVQFCPNIFAAIRWIHLDHHQGSLCLAGPVWQYCQLFSMLNDIHLKMFKMFKLLDESVWMISSGPVWPCQYILRVEIVRLKIEIEILMIFFDIPIFPSHFDQYVVISSWYHDSPDLLRLALLPVPTFFTIFFTTFILEGLQKVSKGLKSGRWLFNLYFHRINLFSQLSFMDTLPRI